MLVRMKTGCVEDVHDFVGERLIREGRATRVPSKKELILQAENAGGPAATVGIEMATLEPKAECAVVRFVRGPKSPRRNSLWQG
jgi:hypothetical protein